MKEQVNDIIVETKEFMGKKYLDIRKHYMDADTHEVKPTTKGIMLNKENFDKILEILKNKSDEIKDYLK